MKYVTSLLSAELHCLITEENEVGSISLYSNKFILIVAHLVVPNF